MQHHRKAHENLLFPARLLANAVQRTGGNVAVRMFDCHQTWFGRMLELVMRSFDPHQKPAIRFQLFDDLLAIQGGYCTYEKTISLSPTP